MLHIGCHLSSSKGYLHMGEETLSIGGDTFQFFTRNPRGGSVKPMNERDAAALNAFMKAHAFAPILAHAPYTLNAASNDPRIREFCKMAMTEDLARLESLPGNLYNFHPGSHTKQTKEEGVARIVDMLNDVILPDQSTTVLLETMSGGGSEIGGAFEELRLIIDGVRHANKVGVCMDLCHVFAAGYDIANDLDGVLQNFDRAIGLNRLKAIHINDSKFGLGERKDRHARIGEGRIGLESYRKIVNHPALRDLPFLLETPNEELDGYAREIALLREMAGA